MSKPHDKIRWHAPPGLFDAVAAAYDADEMRRKGSKPIRCLVGFWEHQGSLWWWCDYVWENERGEPHPVRPLSDAELIQVYRFTAEQLHGHRHQDAPFTQVGRTVMAAIKGMEGIKS